MPVGKVACVRFFGSRSTEGAALCAGYREKFPVRVEGGKPHRVKGEAPWQVKGGSHYRVKGEMHCPGKVDVCVNLYWVLPDAKLRRICSFAALSQPTNLERQEDFYLKLTRHNGRSGKNGTYNPRHNDRRFDVENSEHIDSERARQNVYWDCYRGFTTAGSREDSSQPDFSFEEIEKIYYTEHYGEHVEAQNARNEKTRHTERNRTVADLLKNNKSHFRFENARCFFVPANSVKSSN